MRKLREVQEAKELMSEALDWGMFKWLFEKSRVRETADRANDALDRMERSVKAQWSEQLKEASRELTAKGAEAARQSQKGKHPVQLADPELKSLVEKVKEAHDAARRARMDAEKTFDEAEKQMSPSLAQEGCKKAIHSWELYEKAIRKAEAVMESADSGS
jgi:hypothetical protein